MFNDKCTMEGLWPLNMKDQKVCATQITYIDLKRKSWFRDESLNPSIMFPWVSKGKNKCLLNWALSSAAVKTHPLCATRLSHGSWTYSCAYKFPMYLIPQLSIEHRPQSVIFWGWLLFLFFYKIEMFFGDCILFFKICDSQNYEECLGLLGFCLCI